MSDEGQPARIAQRHRRPQEEKSGGKQPLHVCHVQLAHYGGQSVRAFQEYPRSLAQQGIIVTVIAAKRPSEPTYEVDDAGVEVYRIPVRTIRKLTIDPLWFAVRALRILHQIRSQLDVIHCYTSWEMAVIGTYARLMSIPSCFDIRSGAVSGGVWYRLGAWIQRLVATLFDTCIVISEPLGRMYFGSSKKKYSVVRIGTDVETFTPATDEEQGRLRRNHGLSPDAPVVVYTGLMRKSKGAGTVTDIAIRACRNHDTVRFLLVGGGGDLEECRDRVRAVDVSDRIQFTGEVPPDDVPKYLKMADIGLSYVPKNDLYDPQPPLKTAEYLACALPTVATDTTGQRIYIRDQENGLLVEDRVGPIVRCLLDLVEDPDARRRLADRSRSSILSFQWNRIVRRDLIPVYNQLVRDGG
jgi:glycosyltransferase involved in cell wall biosynthesis